PPFRLGSLASALYPWRSREVLQARALGRRGRGHGVVAFQTSIALVRNPMTADAHPAPPRDSAQMTGSGAILASLEKLGVTDVFGLPGGAIMPFYDELMASTAIRHILVRHEQGAGHAAEGYAAASGRVGVAIATSGPGATNLVTAIADAHM